ncbi:MULTISPECIES: LysR family transcriptional regulator [Thermomonosporaceae]|uniref:LysR family transcriptional regulator n=1 Tax=Thermomonosporaceae TaxID=2012 RepID=UPI00255AC39B|nr:MULTISPECIES: LysR family transcriptional regulator [Thermomonosporaceae]MDL4771130.1 LysR family transcriptional regulator [Actinomadura xylanilytica]
MDVDLPGVRAFVAAVEEMHFGRAAQRLFLTQQALSKRVRRLEQALGTPLFERTTRRVSLTAAGRRFLPLAQEAVTAFDTAVAAVRTAGGQDGGRLRVDIYDERFSPMRIVRGLIDRDPGLRFEPSMRQGLALALPALLNGEIDAAFGQARDLPGPWPPELARRLVHVEHMHAFVGAGHPLASRETLRPAELREAGIAMPDPSGAVEARAYLSSLARRFGAPLRFGEPAVGYWHYGELVRRERTAVALGEACIEVPPGFGLHRIRLVDPVPLVPWCVVWRKGDRGPGLRRMLGLLPVPDLPGEGHWLPDAYREQSS